MFESAFIPSYKKLLVWTKLLLEPGDSSTKEIRKIIPILRTVITTEKQQMILNQNQRCKDN